MIELDDYLQIVQKWVSQFGPWGPVVSVGIYVAATLFPVGNLSTLKYGGCHH